MARRKGQFEEPSLVPLADMLTNTVGIMIFILIFTVLTAGGSVIARRLPLERESELKKAEYYICTKGKIYPLRHALIEKLLGPLGNPVRSVEGFREFARKANAASAEDEHLRLTVAAKVEELFNGWRLNLEFTCDPLPNAGLSMAELNRPDGFFLQDLQRINPSETATIYWVKPDGIDVFAVVRELGSKMGFSSNWRAEAGDEPITFRLGGGGGGKIKIQ